MSKAIIFISGIVVGFLFSLAAYFYITLQSVDDSPSKWEIEITEEEIKKKQEELGMTCIESADYIRKYINSLEPIIETLKNNITIESSNPILLQGKKAREAFFKCDMLYMMAISHKIEFPIPKLLHDNELEANIIAIDLSIGKASALWCESKCIADSLSNVNEALKNVKQKLASVQSVK